MGSSLQNIIGKSKETLLSGLYALNNKNILNEFVQESAAPQHAADIFKNEWITSFPESSGVSAGDKPLYDDGRIQWLAERFELSGKSVLELGPMEASHTYQLQTLGAKNITAIESNTRSFLKCLVAKEILNIDRATFLCGDFVSYMEQEKPKADLCLACGVLYHMTDPLKMIGEACKSADAVFIWTHYYDPDIISNRSDLAHRFSKTEEIEWGGFKAKGHIRSYGAQLRNRVKHLGGKAPTCTWIEKDTILGALKYYGHDQIEIGFEEPNHAAGPAFCLFAQKT